MIMRLFHLILFLLVSLSSSFLGNVKPHLDSISMWRLQSTFQRDEEGNNINSNNTPKSFFLRYFTLPYQYDYNINDEIDSLTIPSLDVLLYC